MIGTYLASVTCFAYFILAVCLLRMHVRKFECLNEMSLLFGIDAEDSLAVSTKAKVQVIVLKYR